METKQIWKKNSNFILNRRIILESASMAIFCLVAETKGQKFRGIPGFYSTSAAVGYTAVIFSAHLVALKCEFSLPLVLGKYSYALGQLTRSPLLPANRARQSIAHARKCT